ncbi:MAG: hypothetical protein FWF79_02365 [Defluviitaleaceae bacterium]|nr:hypothetical protein [Defluviitaleaceae bacterium]
MKIQNSTHINKPDKTPEFEKTNNGNFDKLLKNHMQSSGIDFLIKDALSDVKSEILQEIENITSDETGQNIDIKNLQDLLELIRK